MLAFRMPRVSLPPIQRLREDLEDTLAQAEALDLPLVAIRIAEALNDLVPRGDSEAPEAG